MHVSNLFSLLTVIMCGCVGIPALGLDLSIRIDATQTNHVLQETLYGAFFEDINYAGDGGLYAELIENRSFEYYPITNGELDRNKRGYLLDPLFPWEKIQRSGSTCELVVEDTNPLNSNNTHYVKVQIDQGGGEAGLCNLGYAGIPVVSGECYRISFYVRYEGSEAPSLLASIRSAQGSVMAQASYSGVTTEWQKFETILAISTTATNATFEITTDASGVLCFDMISLFPCSTFNSRPNGLRRDLAQAIADLKPGVFRFPGGCITHGNGLDNAYRWKDSVGDIAERKPNWNRWGYHQTYGLGFFEYFQFCEDIGAEPLPVVPVGVSCAFQGAEYVPLDELDEWVSDVVDLIEFANGSVESEWGAKRFAMGHPEPFNLKYICLGNEEPATPEFRERFPYFVQAIRANYPDIKIIGTSGWWSTIPNYPFMCEQQVDFSDEHYYQTPEWLISNMNRFDTFDRSQPKIFVGEYASGFLQPANKLYNALSEACYLTGIERNADMVYMTTYAPLLARYGFNQWLANLIWFDEKSLVKTPNYYVQQLFSLNKGDFTLQHSVQKYTAVEDLGVAVSLDNAKNEVILKLVNPFDQEINVGVDLHTGDQVVSGSASVVMLSGAKYGENTRANPDNIVPQYSTLDVASTFQLTVAPFSIQFIRLKMKPFHGSGTEQDPYLIENKLDLLEMAGNTDLYDRHFALVCDIDLSGKEFTRAVIAPNSMPGSLYLGVPFTGVLQGNGYSIRNININTGDSAESFIGLFGMLENAEISGVGVENIHIDDVHGTSWCVGGFCGQNQGSTIRECFVEHAVLRGGSCMGGFCGLNSYHGVIMNCYVKGSLSGSELVGGFCGYNYRFSQILNSYAACEIISDGERGGFCSGGDASSVVNSCFWDVDIACTSSSSGGVGLSHEDMGDASLFLGWDFDQVWLGGTRPFLRAFSISMSYSEWVSEQGIPLELREQEESAAGDGIPNLIKFACGLPALLPASTLDLISIMPDDESNFSIRYYQSKRAVDASIEPIWADSLSGPWMTNGLFNVLLEDDVSRQQWKASIRRSAQGFIKLRAKQFPVE